ncbi:calcium incorporation protein MxaA [Sphaerotilus mobilis]|uniref:MxaA protein n=1 Tax=Sphaerotilus mobilis TaxID=47994 RepID=A0A4Q7LX15_9BURK|nr:calcium incorporation protein MxaA [Sphaerotilus mobilis]RZS58768.1 mxaA protein [Sphaerotilus mobilis]
MRARAARRAAAAGLVMTMALALAPTTFTAAAEPRIEQPRSFGHVIGDVLSQRVLLEVDGRELTPTALPAADRVGLWLERRTPRLERDAQGRRWLVIEHQVINAPTALTETRLPALQLTTVGGAVLALPAWPIRIGPITPAESGGADEAAALRPDRLMSAGDAAPLEHQQRLSIALLAGVLLAWAGWWAGRNAIEARRLPFASAWRQMRRLDEADPQAWRALHHAINASAGQVVQGSTLATLLADRPALRPLLPLQGDLDAFFQASDARFFADVDGDASTAPAFPLKRLARALRTAERRGAR